MTKDDIMRMAREATRVIEPDDPDYRQEIFDKEKFANLVAAAEREECAKVCEGRIGGAVKDDQWWRGFRAAMAQCAAAIRARTTP